MPVDERMEILRLRGLLERREKADEEWTQMWIDDYNKLGEELDAARRALEKIASVTDPNSPGEDVSAVFAAHQIAIGAWGGVISPDKPTDQHSAKEER